MQLTDDQAKAYDGIQQWMSNKSADWCYKLAGFAGTGKTTLLQQIINTMDDMPFCCAPTGKAASVLGKKLEHALVTTVHSALYSPVVPNADRLEALVLKLKDDPENGELKAQIQEEKDQLNKQRLSFTSKLRKDEYKDYLFIVDEASMINKKMAEDFQHSGAKVLFVGDPGQLPPVGDAGWFGNGKIDFTLNTVVRQALENPIIRLSMEVRQKGYCNANEFSGQKEICIISKNDFPPKEWLEVNQVLTGSNYLRRRINRFFRKQLGYNEKIPMEGEKLICLKNNFDQYGLINGVPATCLQTAEIDDYGELRSSVLFEDQVKAELPLYKYPFEAHYDASAQEEPWQARYDLTEFDWAYAITVHKSQGSEWDKVLLADDGFWSNKVEQRKQWLYTAITRAKESLIWVVD